MKAREKNPRVSVVIPTYNFARFLPESMESVLAQTFAGFELIVVDDGSTDETAGVIEPYLCDGRVRYVYQENRGLASARNTGIREAGGELVAFLDSDDVWLPEKLERQVRLFDAGGDAALVYCLVEHIDENGRTVPGVSWEPLAGATYMDFLYTNWIVGSGSSVLIRKSVFDEVGLFDEGLTSLEDLNMWMRILRYRRSAYVDEVLVRIRKHSQSMQTDVRRMERNFRAHIEKSVEMFPELGEYREEAYHRMYEGLLYLGYVHGKKRDMLRYYLRAGASRPSFYLKSLLTYFRKYFLRRKVVK